MRWARDAMDAGQASGDLAPDETPGRVRRSRVVLAPRPWRQVGGTIRRRRWQKRPLTGESRKETVKPLRGESRDVSAVPVVLPRVLFSDTGYGRSRPAFPAPFFRERDDEIAKPGQIAPRERGPLPRGRGTSEGSGFRDPGSIAPLQQRKTARTIASNPLIPLSNGAITLGSRWPQHNPRKEG